MNLKSPYFLLIITTLIWGGNFVLGRAVADSIPPYTLSFLRWCIAFIAIFPFTWPKLKAEKEILKNHFWTIFLMSITGIAGFNTLLYIALKYTTSINASLVNSSAPLIVAVLSFFILGERLTKYQIIGVGLSLIGVFWIITKGAFSVLTSLSFNIGDILMVAAVLVWGLYSIIIKNTSKRLPFYSTFVVSILLGILVLFPFFLWEIFFLKQTIILTSLSIFTLFYIGIFASIVAFLAWNTAVAQVGATKAAIFLNFIPLFASVFAILVLDEKIAWYQILGGFFVLVGIAFSTKSDQKAQLKKAI